MTNTLLHLIDTGGPGGAETVFAQISTGLGRLGFESLAVVSRDDWLANRLRIGGIEPVVLPGKGSMNARYLRGLLCLVGREKPSVIITHLMGPAVYGSLAGLCTRTPVVVVFHGQSDLSPTERFRAVKAAIIRRGASAVVFVSEQLRDQLAPRLGLDASRCLVIPNGVDAERIAKATPIDLRKELRLEPGHLLFGSVGNLRKPKAYDIMLKAARLAVDREPRLRFVIAGDTDVPLFDELLALRSQLGLDSVVHFLGLRPDVPNILKALDVFVLSSTMEGFSIACCEAMAAGLPVLATRSGGPEDILDGGRCGLLVPAGDPQALAGAMIQLATDMALRQRLATAGRERVLRNYGVERMLQQYRTLCDSIKLPRAG